MKNLFVITAGLLLLLLFTLSACNSPEQRVKPANETTAQRRPDVAAIESKTDTVEIKEMKFQPAVLTVAAGTTVVFVNNDMVTHDVTEEKMKAWSSQLLPPSKSWSWVADKSADYYCSIHAVMKGKIVVNR